MLGQGKSISLLKKTPKNLQGQVESPELDGAVLRVNEKQACFKKPLHAHSPAELNRIEALLDLRINNQQLSFIYTGASRFELVSKQEAQLFRFEREFDYSAMKRVGVRKINPHLDNCVLFGGSSRSDLANEVSKQLGLPSSNLLFSNFANGEARVEVAESVRDRDVFIVHSSAAPVNDQLVELGLALDAIKRASARSITAILPYYLYSRQDRKGGVRGPISARWVADLYQLSGVDRLVTIDIHAEQIEGFFNCPVDNLAGFPLMIPYLAKKYGRDKIVGVSPDTGGLRRVESAMEILSGSLQHKGGGASEIKVEAMYKKRGGPNEVLSSRLTGTGESIRGATCLIIDDLLDTGNSAVKAASLLREFGAQKIVLCGTHPLLSGSAIEMFRNTLGKSGHRLVDEIITTDTVPLRRGRGDLVTVISVSELLAEAVRRICSGQSASLRELQGYCGSQSKPRRVCSG